MAKKGFQRIVRPATEEEKRRHELIRRKVAKEIPPAAAAGRRLPEFRRRFAPLERPAV